MGAPEAAVTRTENRALSLPTPVSTKAASPRRAYAIAAVLGAMAAAVLAWKQPWRETATVSNARVAEASAVVTSAEASAEARSSASLPPAASVATASDATNASATAAASAPLVVGRPFVVRPPASVKTATPTAQPATSKPYYRFE
ncbi:MAG: hypothetical protein JNK04_19215 [Myxococcales bacterium]|nr:hypothetical protein [Myxococcales bacterium]